MEPLFALADRPSTTGAVLSIRNGPLTRVASSAWFGGLPGESLADLGPRTDDSWSPSNRALFNALFSNHVFEGGELVKTSRAEAYNFTDGVSDAVERSGNRVIDAKATAPTSENTSSAVE